MAHIEEVGFAGIFDPHFHARQDLDTMVLSFRMCKGYVSQIMIMLNVNSPHIQTIDDLNDYANLCEKACMFAGMDKGRFEIYLCPKIYQDWDSPTDPEFIWQCAEWDFQGDFVKGVLAFKAYPTHKSGGTTNSGGGITDFKNQHFREIMHVLQENDLVLSVHSEMMGVDMLMAEQIFFEDIAPSITHFNHHPKIIFEHLSTAKAVHFVKKCSYDIGATITPHHLLFVYNMVKDESGNIIDPHKLCMPVVKTPDDQLALEAAIMDEHFFYGSDHAPHSLENKLKEKPSCGVLATFLLPYVFGNLVRCNSARYFLKNFLCNRGREFYGIEPARNPQPLYLNELSSPLENVFAIDINMEKRTIRQGDMVVGLLDLSEFDFPVVLSF